MRSLALKLISGYQSYVSPYKGFSCAYRAHTGSVSCSTLGYRAIRMKGLIIGLGILRERLFMCGVAHRRYGRKLVRPLLSQRGDCDIGCADLGDAECKGGKGGSSICDCLSLDWSSKDEKKRRKGKGDSDVHLPLRKV